jgi:outer membrane protein OmpA-like peptidoglycan-associated protein
MASPVAVRLRAGIQRAGTLTRAQVATRGLRRHGTKRVVLDGFAAHDYRLQMHHFATMLRATGFLTDNAKTGDLVLIVGCTDRSPSNSFAVHVGLSLMRAIEVKSFLSEQLQDVSVNLVATEGPEDTQLTPGRNEAERRRNRLVELELWRLP